MAVLRHRLTSQTAFPRHRCFFEPKGKRLSARRSPFCIVSLIDTEESQLTVQVDGRDITYDFAELDELMLAYATTIHKSQGSEYPAVVIPLSTQRYPMLQRHLVYTGVTRGKRLVVLLGQRKALAIAVRGARTRRRWSKLGEWLGRAATTLMRCAGCNPG